MTLDRIISKKTAVLVLLATVLLVAVEDYYIWQRIQQAYADLQRDEKELQQAKHIYQTKTATATSQPDWQIYDVEQHGFSFRYPGFLQPNEIPPEALPETVVFSTELLATTDGRQQKVTVSLDSRAILAVKETIEQSRNIRLTQLGSQGPQYSALFLIDGVENRLTLLELGQHTIIVLGQPLDVVSQMVDTFAFKGGQ